MIEALEIVKKDHPESFDKVINFLEFAKSTNQEGLKIFPIPEYLKTYNEKRQ